MSPQGYIAMAERMEELVSKQPGHQKWYEHFEARIARVERAYSGPGRA